jgi:hypothetical protein
MRTDDAAASIAVCNNVRGSEIPLLRLRPITTGSRSNQRHRDDRQRQTLVGLRSSRLAFWLPRTLRWTSPREAQQRLFQRHQRGWRMRGWMAASCVVYTVVMTRRRRRRRKWPTAQRGSSIHCGHRRTPTTAAWFWGSWSGWPSPRRTRSRASCRVVHSVLPSRRSARRVRQPDQCAYAPRQPPHQSSCCAQCPFGSSSKSAVLH